MSDVDELPPSRRGGNRPSTALVVLDQTRSAKERAVALLRKADERIPDEVWLILDECGEKAASHLHRILNDPNFEKRKLHEQIRVIELAMLRSYGAPEGSFKRSATPPPGELEKRAGNALARLARRATFPELTHRAADPVPASSGRTDE